MTSDEKIHGVPPDELDDLRRRNIELEQLLAASKQENEALRASEACLRRADHERQRLVAIMDSSADFIGTASLEGQVIYINAAGTKMVGLDGEDITKRTVEEFFSDEVLPHFRANVMPVVMERGRWEGEYSWRHFRTGMPIPVHSTVFIVADLTTGKPCGLGTVTRNLSDMKRIEAEQVRLKDEVIQMQAAMLSELSTPLLTISDRAVVMPLIGTVDPRRAQDVLTSLLDGVQSSQAQVVILDITGVSVVDTQVADALVRAAKAVRLLGAQMVITGIRPEVAQILVGLGANLSGVITLGSLQSGIAYAVKQSLAPALA